MISIFSFDVLIDVSMDMAAAVIVLPDMIESFG